MPASEKDHRHLVAQIAAHTSWANTTDRTARTSKARAALEAKFLTQADGDPVRAQHLKQAYFKRLALKSAQSRRAAKKLAATDIETGGDRVA